MIKRVIFGGGALPYLLILPQVGVSLVFFYGPALYALVRAFMLSDPFGFNSKFVWFNNFLALFASAEYHQSLLITLLFSVCTMALSVGLGLVFATAANRVIRAAVGYRTLLILPYAVAPALAGVLWLFLFHPTYGVLSYLLRGVGVDWNPLLNSTQAMTLVVVAASWKQISYNFVFFLAGLQSIPRSVREAAAVDGAGPFRQFWFIVLPLLAPTSFFLAVVNLVYAFFDTFGIIHSVTSGGPGTSTNILIYKLFSDGFVGLNLGASSAQSVVLMVIVIGLTVLQFRYVEKRVQYQLV